MEGVTGCWEGVALGWSERELTVEGCVLGRGLLA